MRELAHDLVEDVHLASIFKLANIDNLMQVGDSFLILIVLKFLIF